MCPRGRGAIKDPSISEQIEEVMESERIRPDFTEVIVPEVAVEEKQVKKNTVGVLGQRVVDNKGKVVKPTKPSLSNWQRAELLDNFHKEHGNFEDVKEYVQNEEQNEKTLWQRSKKHTSEMDYERVEQRINDVAKIESEEIKMEDRRKI